MVPSPGESQDFNRYAYVRNNPLRYTDPSGHYSEEEIQQHLQNTYGENWQSYWNAWQADPYWMWILEQAQDNYALQIVDTGQLVQFSHKDGSFAINGGKLHEYQGRGAYALYDDSMELVKDTVWVGYGLETGTFGRLFSIGTSPTGYAGGYFQPMYDYSGEKPSFLQWRYITIDFSCKGHLFAGDNLPGAVTLGYEAVKWAGEKLGVSLAYPPLEAALLTLSVLTVVDNLTVNTADQVSYQYVDWSPPVESPDNPIPSSIVGRKNPNGIGYPAPPGY